MNSYIIFLKLIYSPIISQNCLKHFKNHKGLRLGRIGTRIRPIKVYKLNCYIISWNEALCGTKRKRKI